MARTGMVRAGYEGKSLEREPPAAPVVTVGSVKFGNDLPISIIAGPCQLESRAHALEVAGALKEIAGRLKIGLVYKTSFDKANRTSGSAARGIGLAQALPIFAEIRSSLGLPVLTDVHEAAQCAEVAQAVDVLQIPAFLCRQTDLLLAAAATGKVVNVKKGQFLAPWDMANVVGKITGGGNPNVLVTERGASFGYNTLVSDMRALPIMARTTGAPVIFDATHSVQQPGGKGTSSGGEREFVPVLARAAVAVGVAGVFIETHPDPDRAPSDGPNMVPLREFEALVRTLMEFDALAKRDSRANEADIAVTASSRMPPALNIIALATFSASLSARALDPVLPHVAEDFSRQHRDRRRFRRRLRLHLCHHPAGARRRRRPVRQGAADDRLPGAARPRQHSRRGGDVVSAAVCVAAFSPASAPAACFRSRSG